MMRRIVRVCSADGAQAAAELEWTDRPPWSVVLRLPGADPIEESAGDLFACLLAVRRAASEIGWRVCVAGARTDAWPSRMSSQMGGAALVYVHALGRPARNEDLHPVFDDAPCEAVGSVEEQSEFRRRWLESLRDGVGIP
jgi:hypothetical protein